MKFTIKLLAVLISLLATQSFADSPPITDIFKMSAGTATGVINATSGTVNYIAPGTSGNFLQSNGTGWISTSFSPGATTWGNITGLLSSQTDLQSALNLKANISSLATVATTGSYSSLTGVPINLSQFTNNVGFITSAGAPVQSVFGRTGSVLPQGGDYNTSLVTEGTNLYFTTSRARSSVSATSPIVYSSGVFSIPKSTLSTNGYLSSADWLTFNSKQAQLTFSSPLVNTSQTISLSNTTVTPGIYNCANISVDAKGRITFAQNGSCSGGGGGGGITGLAGDVLATGPGLAVATIAPSVVSNSKLSDMAAHTYKGNNTGSTSVPIDVTSTQLTADLDVFTSSLKGLTPLSGGGTANFLRADGTWAAPAGGANQTLSNLTSPTAVNQDLSPGSNASKDIGDSTNNWKDLYLSGIIYTNGGYQRINVGGATLYDADGSAARSLNWNTRIAYDASGTNSSLDYDQRLLYHNDGTTKSIDYQGGKLYDSAGNASADYQGYVLQDNNGGLSLDWLARQVYNLSGDELLDYSGSNFDFQNLELTNIANPTSAQNAATKNYVDTNAVSTVTASAPLISSGGLTPNISIPAATFLANGYLTSADWSTFNGKQNALTIGNLSDVGTDGITVTGGTGAVIGSGTSLGQHVADASHNGYLNSTDWGTFNGKQSALTFGSISTSTTGVSVGSGSNSTVGPNVTVDIQTANTSQPGLLSSTDWNTFNGKQSSLSFTAPLVNTTGTISCNVSSGSQPGCLSSTDWTTFNGKQAAGNYITALSGDVVAAGPGSSSSTIQSNVVSNSKLAQMAAHTYKGNNTGSTANASDITSTQLTADLNQFTSLLQGLVPSSGGGTSNFLRADGTWTTPSGGGTVSSVDLTMPAIFSVTGNPVTTSGTLAVSLANQNANLVWASPSSGPAAPPTFRSLVNADLPSPISISGTITGSQLISNVSTGTAPLAVTSTTRVSNLNAATAGNADTVTTNANLTGDVTSSGNSTSYSATVPVNKGGTGQTSYTDGQLLIGNTSGNTLTKTTLTAGSNISITNGNGSISIAAAAFASPAFNYTSQTTTYNAAVNDFVVASSSSFTVTLPTAAGQTGKLIFIQHQGISISQVYTLNTTSAQTIGGLASGVWQLWTNQETVGLMSNGANWLVIYHYAMTPDVSDGAITITAISANPTKGNSPTVDRMIWSRDGQFLNGRHEFQNSTATGSASGTGDYLYRAVPAGLTIDANLTTFYNTALNATNPGPTSVCGTGGWANASGSGTGAMGYTVVYDTTKIRIMGLQSTASTLTGTRCMSSGNTSDLTAAGARYFTTYRVPIVGWQP